jgi:hypothetical protein
MLPVLSCTAFFPHQPAHWISSCSRCTPVSLDTRQPVASPVTGTVTATLVVKMKFTPALLAALSATGALGAGIPAQDRQALRQTRGNVRRSGGLHSNPLKPVTVKEHGPLAQDTSSAPTILYSESWSGEVVTGTGFDYARGTVVVPTPSVPNGQPLEPDATPGYYDGVIWVGYVLEPG